MKDASSRIAALAADFVAQLQEIAKDEFLAMLGGVRTGRGSTKSRSAGGVNSGGGAKRDAGELEQLGVRFLAFVKAHPGKRIEEAHTELGTTTKDLALPIRKLIASKAIRTEGQRRATRYFPAGGAKKAKAKRRKR
jgi:hypothetical protein